MKKMMLHFVIVLLLAGAVPFACSDNKEAESEKTAKAIVKKIQTPIDQARSVKKQQEDRSSGIEDTLKDQKVSVNKVQTPIDRTRSVKKQQEDRSSGIEDTLKDTFEAVLKISRLDDGLNLIDEIIGQDPAQAIGSPSTMLKGMLQGLDWIDSTRLIVLGISATNEQLEGFLLIPFEQENNSFQASFKAYTGPDYYIVAVPPGPENRVAPAPTVESALAKISRSKSKELLSIELAVGKILEKSEKKIHGLLEKKRESPQNLKPEEFALTPQEVQAMVENLLETGRQLKTFSFGIDVHEDVLLGFVEAVPVKESKLSKVFTSPGETELLGTYRPNFSMNFRSRSFDISGFYELLQESFGIFYEKLGISTSEIVNISKRFTGEAAGGISIEKDGTRFEMIAVLKETDKGDDFLEKVYLPWLMKYGEDMTKQMEKQLGIKTGNLFERSKDTTVSDRKVLGVRFQQLYFPTMGDPVKMPEGDKPNLSETRMTTVGNFLLFAPDDKGIQRLIKVVGSFKENPAKGPIMIVNVDMTGYLEAIKRLMPEIPVKDQPLPKMGSAVTKIDFIDGKARSTSSMRIADIKTLAGNLKKLVPSEKQPKPDLKTTESSKPKVAKAIKKKSEIPKKDVNYWMNKGALCATYGNDKAAIRYYRKALELKPNNSRALFQQGVSYGELGQYEKALTFIDKALAIDTRNGLYYYGRGRVFLLSGDKKKAVEDLKQAAVLGNRVAQNYLQNTLHIEWQ